MKYKYLLFTAILLGCMSCAAHAQNVPKDIVALRVMQQYGIEARILRSYAQLQDTSPRSDGRFLFGFDGDPGIYLLLDRDYWVIVAPRAAQGRDVTVYSFNPQDGQCALNISVGNDGYDKTDAMLEQSPGFTKITRGDGMVANEKVVWRRWSDDEHLYSDCTTILPRRSGKIKTNITIIANSEARRQSLEDSLSSLKLLEPDNANSSSKNEAPIQKLAKAMSLDSSKWSLTTQTPDQFAYRDIDFDQITFALQPPKTDAIDPRNLEKSREAIRANYSANGEALVEAFPITIGGVIAQWVVTKQRQDNLGFTYRARVLINTSKNVITISIECPERGTTGMREALVNVINVTKAKDAGKPSEEAYLKMRDPYDSKYDNGALYMDSDDRKWDEGMAKLNHPLVRARSKMQAIVDALKIPEEISQSALFSEK